MEKNPWCLGFCNPLSQEKLRKYTVCNPPRKRKMSFMFPSLDPHLSLWSRWINIICLMKKFQVRPHIIIIYLMDTAFSEFRNCVLEMGEKGKARSSAVATDGALNSPKSAKRKPEDDPGWAGSSTAPRHCPRPALSVRRPTCLAHATGVLTAPREGFDQPNPLFTMLKRPKGTYSAQCMEITSSCEECWFTMDVTG